MLFNSLEILALWFLAWRWRPWHMISSIPPPPYIIFRTKLSIAHWEQQFCNSSRANFGAMYAWLCQKIPMSKLFTWGNRKLFRRWEMTQWSAVSLERSKKGCHRPNPSSFCLRHLVASVGVAVWYSLNKPCEDCILTGFSPQFSNQRYITGAVSSVVPHSKAQDLKQLMIKVNYFRPCGSNAEADGRLQKASRWTKSTSLPKSAAKSSSRTYLLVACLSSVVVSVLRIWSQVSWHELM